MSIFVESPGLYLLRLVLSVVYFLGAMTVVGSAQDALVPSKTPQPGELYREFSKHNGGDHDWRVTDKMAVEKFDAARDHLPNSQLELRVDDLEHAVRAEAMLDRWGGHRGTIRKRIRFNDHEWIVVPEIQNVPDGIRPEMLMFQDNPVVDVPLQHLVEGINVFDADCNEAGGFGWAQWGLYSLTLRVYYDREAKGERFDISGSIVLPSSGAKLGDNPIVEVSADAPMGVARIDVLAAYQGYDEDGDGNYGGYHESHFQLTSGEPNEIRDHVATLWKMPYRTTWDTHWVPDQQPNGVSFIARIQDSRGYWSVTKPVRDLTLRRDDVSVKLYQAQDVPENFAVRINDETKHCTFDIPESDSIQRATETAIHLRTWHGWDGHHEPLRINDHEMLVNGKNHFFDYDLLSFPPSVLHSGENRFTIHSTTEHHMLEALWPGPAIVARIPQASVAIRDDTYQQREHFVVDTPTAIYWLDKRSGGLSRILDRDGNDWIAFKKEADEQYPRSAAGAYRGLPNALYGGAESGFGHPGKDQATSRRVGDASIVSTSLSGQWKLVWTFTDDSVHLAIETADATRPYWFLYEGTIAGRFAPSDQYFATDTLPPSDQPRDYFANDRCYDHWRWAYFGDTRVPRVMYIVHEQSDQAMDTFAHLGDTPEGIESSDGMVVFGFGRGESGIEPLLKGDQSFRIGFVEKPGNAPESYRQITSFLSSLFETALQP